MSVPGKPTLLRLVESVAGRSFGAVRLHNGLICSRLVIFCRRCGELGRLGGLACRGLGALGGLLGPGGSASCLAGGCFRLHSGFLGGRGGPNRPSGDRRSFMRGHRIPFRRTPIGEQFRRGTVLSVPGLRHALRPPCFCVPGRQLVARGCWPPRGSRSPWRPGTDWPPAPDLPGMLEPSLLGEAFQL